MDKIEVLKTIDDLAGSFLYYDRKEDERLPVGKIEELVRDGVITKEEIVQRFKAHIDNIKE